MLPDSGKRAQVVDAKRRPDPLPVLRGCGHARLFQEAGFSPLSMRIRLVGHWLETGKDWNGSNIYIHSFVFSNVNSTLDNTRIFALGIS